MSFILSYQLVNNHLSFIVTSRCDFSTTHFIQFSCSGVFGSGVCVFSRYPIIDAYFYRYTLNGYMYKITHADWFGGKGVGYCLIDHPKQPIHFFATHVSKYFYFEDMHLVDITRMVSNRSR